MSVDRSRDILFPVVILLAVAVGAFLGGMLTRGGASAPSPAVGSSGETKQLTDAIEALRQELVRERLRVDGLSAVPAASERADASKSAGSQVTDMTSELHAATAQLAQAVEALRDAARRSGGDRAPLIAPVSAPNPTALGEVASRPRVERVKAHQMWTYQQVMDRYGAPDSVGGNQNGSITWWYKLGAEKELYFDFIDGRVIDVRD